MNKILWLDLLMVSLFFTASSQTTKFEYGFQGGINLNTRGWNGVKRDRKDVLTGLNIGGHVKFNTTEHFGVKVQLSYDQNGYAYNSIIIEDFSGTHIIKGDLLHRFNFLNLPVMAAYSFGKKISITIGGGVFLGMLLNNKLITKYKEPLPPGQASQLSSSSGNYRLLNYGVSVGFGVQLPITKRVALDFELRNQTGLANLYKSRYSNSSKLKTNCTAIIGGISFLL